MFPLNSESHLDPESASGLQRDSGLDLAEVNPLRMLLLMNEEGTIVPYY